MGARSAGGTAGTVGSSGGSGGGTAAGVGVSAGLRLPRDRGMMEIGLLSSLGVTGLLGVRRGATFKSDGFVTVGRRFAELIRPKPPFLASSRLASAGCPSE